MMSKVFYGVLGNTMVASVTNNFVWFALTFWVYLQTRSVTVTSVMAGIYLVTVAGSGFLLGTLVDRYRKKTVMLLSSGASLLLYGAACLLLRLSPGERFTEPGSPVLWGLIVLTLGGALAGNLRGIALSTLVTILVPEGVRDRANGMVGTVNGVGFLGASIFSGLVIGYLGVLWMLGIALGLTALVLAHLLLLHIPEPAAHHAQGEAPSLDLRGSVAAVRAVPGLIALIGFHAFNNFLGGVFMALMDAYGLELVSVQVWGALWGVLSLGFIAGGIVVARRGLGANPLRSLFLANIAMWVISLIFPLRSSVLLLSLGMFLYLCLIPIVEAAEQTILQQMIPLERQGRVFGFAQSVEQAASPITAFLIGPIAELFFIPFMTTGAGVTLLGPWFGTGKDRGLALLFIVAALIGLAVTLLCMGSASYRLLSQTMARHRQRPAPDAEHATLPAGAL